MTASKDNLNCYVLVTDKKVAGTPISQKRSYDTVTQTVTYSGKEQTLFADGSHYVLTSGSLEYKNAGEHVLEVTPEEGYCWADGTNGTKQVSATIQKHELTVHVKSEAVAVGETPKYELEYGYARSDADWTLKGYEFVNGEDENTISGYVKPTISIR